MSEKVEKNTSPKPLKGPIRGGPMGGGAMANAMIPGEKPKNFRGGLRRLAGYLRPQAPVLLAVLLFTVLSNVLFIFGPRAMGRATDALFDFFKLKSSGLTAVLDYDLIYRIIILLVVLYFLSTLFAYFQQRLMARVAQKVVYNLRREMNEKLARLPLNYFDSHTHGEILSRVANDADNISNTLQQSLVQLMGSVVILVGVIVMMLTISLPMTVIMLLIIPLFLLVLRPIIKRSQKHFVRQQKVLGHLNGHVEEMLSGHVVVKAFGKEKSAVEQFDKLNQELFEAGFKAQFISGIMMPTSVFINNLGYVAICIVGGLLVSSGRLFVGDIQAFIMYARQFSHPLNQLSNIANIIQSTVASAERVFELLDEPEQSGESTEISVCEADGGWYYSGNGEKLSPVQGNVCFDNVSFSYKPDQKLIENMDIAVKQGQTVAIVGPTGAGKTTLVNLLMRFYELDGGRITIDGIDITRLPRGDLRSVFGMVLQDTWLFNGTIRENIAYGKSGVSEEDIIRAAKTARADHFIRTLAQGYETQLNEEASNISQGQKQLLTIARAVLANPPILILDEATSNVDTRTEVQIQKAMQALMKGRTNFVIAHRLSTIRSADLILVMNHGAVIEQGTHDELLEAGGFYADLYKSQFEGAFIDEASA